MFRISALALVALGLSAGVAPAQVVYVQSPPRVVYYSPPPVTYSYYEGPAVSYASPAVSYSYYSAPPVSYASPAVSYSYYSAPPVSYSYYSAPGTVVVPATVTTRSYFGLGIFRPLGVTRETYITPR